MNLPATAHGQDVNPVTGEMLDLATAGPDDLGALLLQIREARTRLADFERDVSDAALTLMDRAAVWTMRAGGAELKAPSPSAGSAEYPADMLRAALNTLVTAGTIDPAAAEYALKRQLTLTADVPWDVDLAAVLDELHRATINMNIAGTPLTLVAIDGQERPVKAGINALRKNPATHAALDSACVVREPVRKVSVKAL